MKISSFLAKNWQIWNINCFRECRAHVFLLLNQILYISISWYKNGTQANMCYMFSNAKCNIFKKNAIFFWSVRLVEVCDNLMALDTYIHNHCFILTEVSSRNKFLPSFMVLSLKTQISSYLWTVCDIKI